MSGQGDYENTVLQLVKTGSEDQAMKALNMADHENQVLEVPKMQGLKLKRGGSTFMELEIMKRAALAD